MLGIVLRITERKRTEEALKQLNATLEGQVKERTAALLEKQEQLRSLASELVRSEERERKSLATKLHDNLAQSLALCKMKLEIAQHTEATPSKTLAESKELLDEALSATRLLMADLRPPLLGADDDLSTAVSWVVKKLARHGLHVTVRDDRRPKVLAEEILTVTYQAIQELFNVLKHAQTKQAMLVLECVGDHLEVMVIDRGVGFDASRRLTPGEEGGFGLFNIRERIELVGGALDISSVLSAGTCVKLTVPLATSLLLNRSGEVPAAPVLPAKAVDKQKGGPEGGSSKIRIVLVDDHRMMRQGLRSVLEEQGEMEVVGEASDGAMAVDVTQRLRPDVVIMDINMPGMNGLEATRRIKTEFPEVTVIGLSMHKEEKMVEAMQVAGASAYISKAQVFEALCAAIRQHARKQNRA
jgi:CheY-like chemotaxis protein/anti-sigma regulatory factor (Ser/Thr protein kinase)